MHARARTVEEPRLLTPEEAAALHDQNHHHDDEPATRETALHWLDLIHGILGETPEIADLPTIQPDHHSSVQTRMTYGLCHDCTANADQHLQDQHDRARHAKVALPPATARAEQHARESRARRRYQLGQLHLCRHHATLRIRANQHATQPLHAVPDRMPPQPPANLEHWIDAAAHNGLTHRAIELHLHEWRIPEDTRIGLLERYSDRAAAIALLHADTDAWLTQQQHADPGRCDRCRHATGDEPRYLIAGRHLCARCATNSRPRPRPDNPKEAAA